MKELIDFALKTRAGGDNITVVVIRLRDPPPKESSDVIRPTDPLAQESPVTELRDPPAQKAISKFLVPFLQLFAK